MRKFCQEEEKEINGVKIKTVPAYNLTKPFHQKGKEVGRTYTIDALEAAETVKVIKPKKVIPMHYGTFSETPGNPEKI